MSATLRIIAVFLLVLVQAATLFGEMSTAVAAVPAAQPSLKWRSRIIAISFSNSLLRPAPNVKHGTDVVAALRRSLRTWEEAAGVEFREVFTDKQNVSPQGQAGDGVSLVTLAASAENSLLFAKNPDEVAATTRVFYDARGRISEADIALNPYQQFSADGTFGTFDLEATLTHEIGHVLGLDHSPVRGSAMFENFGKNGLFGLQGFSHRTLSEIDRAAIRAKYGAPVAAENCCGSVSAKLQFPDGRAAAEVEIWLEDAVTGKIVAQATTGPDGAVEVQGLPSGSYSLFSARKERGKRPVPMQFIGSVDVELAGIAQVSKKLEAGNAEIDLNYAGLNGQLAVSSVPINAGKSFTVYLGGRNLTARGSSIRFSSPYLQVTPGSIAALDYGSDLSVLSFEVVAAGDTPVGEYTIFLESASGAKAAIVGGIAVREFNVPFSNFVLDRKLF